MKVIAILLLVAGVVGLILSALFPALSLAGILGAVAALLSGLGFLLMGRCRPCCQRWANRSVSGTERAGRRHGFLTV